MNSVVVTISDTKGNKLTSFEVRGDSVMSPLMVAGLVKGALSHWFTIKKGRA